MCRFPLPRPVFGLPDDRAFPFADEVLRARLQPRISASFADLLHDPLPSHLRQPYLLGMARIISTGQTPAKTRHAHMRSCAEVLRLLAQRSKFDAESRDMTAFLIFNLRGIYTTIDESAHAWDERNYWKKAENLREKWRWTRTSADALENALTAGRWLEVQHLLLELVPHFSSVTVTSITRDADWWCGAYRALMKSRESS